MLGLVNSTCRTPDSHCARVRYNASRSALIAKHHRKLTEQRIITQAYRSKQIFEIWADVWVEQRSRVKFVLSTQAAARKQNLGAIAAGV